MAPASRKVANIPPTSPPWRISKSLNRIAGYILTAFKEIRPQRPISGPLVSVIIATYHRPRSLRLAIQSVLNQEYQDFEILVVGDHCTDITEQLVASFEDCRITWINLPENSGSQSLPNNEGLRLAKGTYVAYLGHDDLWLPGHLAELVWQMERKQLDAATTRAYSFGPPETNAHYLTYPDAIRKPYLTVPPSAFCHRRDLLKAVGLWQDYKALPPAVPPDGDFISRICAYTRKTQALRKLTVIKPPSAWRKDSYMRDDPTELESWARKLRNPRKVVFRICLKLAARAVRPQPVLLPHELQTNPANEHIVDTWRRVRGLPPR